jgi:TonB family protein
VRDTKAQPFAPPRAPLALALALSLLGHALLLGAVRLPRAHERAAPAFTAHLTGTLVLDRVRPSAPPAPAAAPPAPRRTTAPVRQAMVPAAQAPARAAPPAPRPTPFVAAQDLAAPPLAQGDPLAGHPLPQLQWRRLAVHIWVRADGSVEKVNLESPEVDPATAQQVVQAVERMRFVPGLRDGQPVPAYLDTRLCFDEAGMLLRDAPRCLVPGAAPEGLPAPER